MVVEKGISWPQICDGRGFEGEIARLYRVGGTPNFFLLDRAGRIALKNGSLDAIKERLPEVAAGSTVPPRTPRDAWQRPVKVMDLLEVKPGSTAADVGAGEGYFTLHLAARVGPEGKVYAVDINEKALNGLRDRAKKENLGQVETILSAEDDPNLPENSVDVVLVVNAYHEFRQYDAMLQRIYRALKPGGRLGVLENPSESGLGRPREEYHKNHDLPVEILIADAARNGLRLLFYEADFAGPSQRDKYYFVIFQKPVEQ